MKKVIDEKGEINRERGWQKEGLAERGDVGWRIGAETKRGGRGERNRKRGRYREIERERGTERERQTNGCR